MDATGEAEYISAVTPQSASSQHAIADLSHTAVLLGLWASILSAIGVQAWPRRGQDSKQSHTNLSLPQAVNRVWIESSVTVDNGNLLYNRLSDQQPVKRVTMVERHRRYYCYVL